MILQSKADKDDDREQKLCSLYDNALKIYSNVVTEELLSKDLKESKEVMENCITHAKELEMTILDKEYKYPTLVFDIGFDANELCWWLYFLGKKFELQYYRINDFKDYRSYTRLIEQLRSILFDYFEENTETKGRGFYTIYVNHKDCNVHFRFEINIHRQTSYIKDFKVGRYDEKSR